MRKVVFAISAIAIVFIAIGCVIAVKLNKNSVIVLQSYKSRISNASFLYPEIVEPSKVRGFEGGFDRVGRFNAVKGNIDYLPEIRFIDNTDNHITSFGVFKSQESIKIGNYDVSKKTRDWESSNDKSEWGAYPVCAIQYHLLKSQYVFCDDSPQSPEIEQAIRRMIKTFHAQN